MAFAREEVSLVFERSLGGVLGKGGSLGLAECGVASMSE